ncbi:glycosyl hydrolases family 11 domain-containing protein [Sarocladium implicatum]|nr:glycosyl hydrolases family 11 domain-containing protein [Sarocladium implicatum]
MVQLTKIAFAALAATGAVAAPAEKRQQGTPSSTGQHGGYYYSWWTDGASPVTYENLDGGGYRVNWQSGGNFVGGKGWNPGNAERTITYSGTYSPNGNSYLAVYGWLQNPLVEYYVVENFHPEYDPSGAASDLGTVECDGGQYRVGQSTRTNAPSIEGTSTFQQYWSVRVDKRVGGSVDMACHFGAWANAGLPIGSHNYQIVATEGYRSSGSAEIYVEG